MHTIVKHTDPGHPGHTGGPVKASAAAAAAEVVPSSEPPADLAALLVHAAGGCNKSFEALYQRSHGRLLAIILRVNSDRGEAEELLQETYIKVWRQCRHFDAARGQAEQWLARIARNSAIDSLKRRSSRPARSDPPPTEEADDVYAGLACPEAGPCEVLSQRGLNTAVQQCLRALPPAQRESLSLAYYSGMSHSEIAQHVGRPLGTVKSWMRRSLQGMQAVLTDQL